MENSLIAIAKNYGINAGLFSLLILIVILFIKREFKSNEETITTLKDKIQALESKNDETEKICADNYKEVDDRCHYLSEQFIEINGARKYLIKKVEEHDKDLRNCFDWIRSTEKTSLKLEMQIQTALSLTDKAIKHKCPKND